jgi:hypothetical protein
MLFYPTRSRCCCIRTTVKCRCGAAVRSIYVPWVCRLVYVLLNYCAQYLRAYMCNFGVLNQAFTRCVLPFWLLLSL